MKTLRLILFVPLFSLWLYALSGCAIGGGAVAKKTVTRYDKEGKITTVDDFTSRTRAWVAWGDARLAMDRMKVSNSEKTQSIGFSGFETETTTTNVPAILKGAGGLIGEAVKAYTTGGL